MKNIGVLTSGGDCQGMNACLSIIVKMAGFNKINIYGIRRGYQGLIDDDMIKLKYEDVSHISTIGGTFLHTSRCADFMTPEGKKKAVENIKKRKLDAIIVIGGDGSFKGVRDINKLGVKTIAIPGTIDNDLFYTEISLGFYSAVGVAADAVKCIKQTMYSHERCSVIEVMGRNCGSIALHVAAATASDVLAIPEHKLTEQQVIDKVKKSIKRGVISPTVIVAENQFDVNVLAEKIEKATGKETRASILGYMQRGGTPSVRDHMLAMEYAVYAFELILNEKYNRAVARKEGKIIDVSMDEALSAPSNFKNRIYNIFNTLNS